MRGLRVRPQRLALAILWRPEWRIAAVAAAAWAMMITGIGMGSMGAAAGRDELSALVSCTPMGMRGMGVGGSRYPLVALSALPSWSLMAMAMMLPATLPAVRHVGLNSMRHRRQRAMNLYAAVYVGCWLVFGLAAVTIDELLNASGLGERALLALALAIAAWWQLTRARRRALFACGRTVPLPPTGWRADAGCARFALLQAQRCIVSCWAIMFVMLVVGVASLPWMGALTGVVVAEELTIAGRRITRPAAAAFVAAAVAVAAGV